MSVETLTLQKPEPSSEPPHLLPEPEMDYNNEFTDWESTFNFFANELLNEDPCTYQGASTPNTGGLPTPPVCRSVYLVSTKYSYGTAVR